MATEIIRDWRQFERPDSMQRLRAQEREEASKKKAAYEEYVEFIEKDQVRTPRRYKIVPLSFEDWCQYLPADVADYALAGQIATHAALTSKFSKEEADEREADLKKSREAVLAGKRDPNWTLPATAKTLRMIKAKVDEFNEQQAGLFVLHNPDYYKCMENVEAISKFLSDQGVNILHEDCIKSAWLHLRELGGFIKEHPPEPEPVPTPVEELELASTETGLTEGYDPETGEPRNFTEREIWSMDSVTFKKAFKMWTRPDGTDNRARFTGGRLN